MFSQDALGRNIRKLRVVQDLSIRELAKRAGVTVAAVHFIEKGQRLPFTPTLCRLASALGTSIDLLLSSTDPLVHETVILNKYRNLTEEDKAHIRDYLEFKWHQTLRRGKDENDRIVRNI